MNRDGCFSLTNLCVSLCAATALAIIGSPAIAALTNKYNFNDNTADDSVGGMDGVIVDNTGISRFVGGAFDMSANNGAGSNQDFSLGTTVGTYIDLPNRVLSDAVEADVFGAASLEVWFTTQFNRGWAEVLSFGSSEAGENISTGIPTGAAGGYVAVIPMSGDGGTGNDFRATTRTGNTERWVAQAPATPLSTLPTGVKQHVVFTLNHNDTDGGTKPNGTARLYLNGTDVGSAEIAGFLDFAGLNDVNNWLGRSQWPDALYDGSIDEFRIYSHALTPGDVAASVPDPAPFPVLIVDRDTGNMSLANQTTGNVQVKGYSITSADGAFNPGGWVTIDTGTFDPNGTWTASAVTSTNLAESVTGGVLDGGTITPSSSQGIGSPWHRTPFEDVAFTFTLGDGTEGNGIVQYSGTPRTRSDLDGDGAVTVDDWALFVPNSFTSFPGETPVGAYLKGDLDGDLDNDYGDFLMFKTDFIAAQGAGAFAALTGAVPEPSSLALSAMLSAMLFGACRKKRRGI